MTRSHLTQAFSSLLDLGNYKLTWLAMAPVMTKESCLKEQLGRKLKCILIDGGRVNEKGCQSGVDIIQRCLLEGGDSTLNIFSW